MRAAVAIRLATAVLLLRQGIRIALNESDLLQ